MKKNIFDNKQIWEWVDSNEDNIERFDFTEKLTPAEVKSIIDIGCGHGGFLKLISNRRANIRCVGIDNSSGALEHIPFEKQEANITNVPYSDMEFDCVCALEVLEHLNPNDFEKALGEIVRLSKRYVIVSVPYKEDIRRNMVRCPNCYSEFHYDGHMQSFDEDKIEGIFSGLGFSCVSHHRLGWSENYKYHKLYVRLFYPNQIGKSPHYTVCPVCDKELNPEKNKNLSSELVKSKKSFSMLRTIKNSIKYFWPKEKNSYWIIALYKRN